MWKQIIGVAMGIHPAPSFANIYLARRIDRLFTELGNRYGTSEHSALRIFKRFLDDIFQIYTGTTKNLHKMYDEINRIHPTLKFTMVHTSIEGEPEIDKCNCEPTNSIPFLDTSLSIQNGKIDIDLYIQKEDRQKSIFVAIKLPPKVYHKINSIFLKFKNSEDLH